MKKLTYILLLVASLAYSQDKLLTKNGQITFEATVSSFEEVKANLNNAACVLNTKTGDMAVVLFIKSFKFKNGLMQEHFNENYLESDKYPKSVFIGKIENFNYDSVSNSPAKYTISGTIEIHGKKKNISAPITIYKKDKQLILDSSFQLKPDDFGIEIPSIVGYKIAKIVTVTFDFKLN